MHCRQPVAHRRWDVEMDGKGCCRLLVSPSNRAPRDGRSISDFHSSPELQLQRLMRRDSSAADAASARIKSQLSIADKLQYADIVVDNSGSIQDLHDQVDALVRHLHRDAGWLWRFSWLVLPFGLVSAFWTLFWRLIRREQRKARRKK